MIYVERSFSQILIEYIRIVYLLSDDLRSDSFSKDSSLNPQASNHIIKIFLNFINKKLFYLLD